MLPIELNSFQIPPSPEQAHLQEKLLIKGMMEVANVVSLPARAFSYAMDKFIEDMQSIPVPKEMQPVIMLRNEIINSCSIPEVAKHSWNQTVDKIEILKKQVKEHWFTHYHIPQEDTEYFFESVGHNLAYVALWGTGKLATRLTKAAKNPKISFAESYIEDKAAFSKVKEFNGALKKDLVIVRYLNEGSIIHKSYKWWTTPTEANFLNTIARVENRLALLKSFGTKTHVTVARIPKGTRVPLLHGRAKFQYVKGKNNANGLPEFRPGGGYQIRLKEFDESWIVQTRRLSDGLVIKPETFASSSAPSGRAFSGPLVVRSLNNLSAMEEAAQKIIDFSEDLTGVSFVAEKGKEMKQLFVKMISDPHNAPKEIVNQILKEPEKLLAKVINSPKEFMGNIEAFSNDPSLMSAIGVVGAAFTITSLMNEILPALTVISHKALKKPIEAPLVITKEVLNLTVNKVKGIWYLSKGLLTNPLKTGEQLIKGVIKTPIVFFKNIKNLFGGGSRAKKKAKRKAKKLARLHETMQIQIDLEQIQLKATLEKTIPACYKVAQQHWMIQEDKQMELYFSEMLEDWKRAKSVGGFSADFVQFVVTVTEHLRLGQFCEVARLSPTAHLSEPTAPRVVAYVLAELAQNTLQLASNIKRLEATVAIDQKNQIQLREEISSYSLENKALIDTVASFAKANQDFAETNRSFAVALQQYKGLNKLNELDSQLSHVASDAHKIQALRARIASNKGNG